MLKEMLKSMGIKIAVCAAAAVVGLTVLPMTAEAKMVEGTFISIPSSGVTDSITVNGVTVNAVYKTQGSTGDWDETYSCAALVKKFYRDVYGRDVNNLIRTTSVPNIDQGTFEATSTPKVGDIVRDNESVHWAIVKNVDDRLVTVIQQNAWDNSGTKAWVDAKILVGDGRYTFFTWSGNTGSASQPEQTEPSFTYVYQDPDLQDSNAVIRTKVNNPQRLHVQNVGCYIKDTKGNVIKKQEESCSRAESQFNIWYDINAELGITLTPGTTYKYQFYINYGGTEYLSAENTFTTTGTAPSDKNTNTSVTPTGAPAPSPADAESRLYTLQELIGEEEWGITERLGEAQKVNGNTHYFAGSSNMLFYTQAPVTVTYGNDGKVKSATWEYVYNDSTCKIECGVFYEALVEAGNIAFREEGVGMCKNKNNDTTTWDGIAEIEMNVTNGLPSVKITVEHEYIPQ